MARSDVHPVHRFDPWQVWPGSFDNPPVDGNFPVPAETGLKISTATRIASMGSCFAREIKRRLLQQGYNYLSGGGPRQCRLGAGIQYVLHAPDI